MYAFWLIGMATEILDAAPSHWLQLFCALPFFIADGLTVAAAPLAMVYLNLVGAFPEQTLLLANAFFVTMICTNWLYFSLFESSPARGTPGKVFMELAVVGQNGSDLGFISASVRHFSKLLSALTLYIPLVGRDKRSCLHDAISRSSVVTETV